MGLKAGVLTGDTALFNNTAKAKRTGKGGGDGTSNLAAGAVNNVKDSAKKARKNSGFFKGLQTDLKILISLIQVFFRILRWVL